MNIKLSLMSLWIPKFVLINELKQTSNITNEYIDNLFERYSIPKPPVNENLVGNLQEQRLIMAKNHNTSLNTLIEVLGFDKAVMVGRKEMFKAGYKMGLNIKKRLNVKDIDDAIIAARIIYRVLGINFTVEENGKDILLRIKSCELASLYTSQTCEIMSATDEGVLKGLNDKMSMKFLTRITEGADECTACIKIKS
jgi:hypothetical protein